MMTKGFICDLPAAFGLADQHTFCKTGPKEGVEGKGRTRIDSILSNRAATALATNCRLRWELLQSDHVPVEIQLDVKRFRSKAFGINLPAPFPIPELKSQEKKERRRKAEEDWQDIWEDYQQEFHFAVAGEDVETMHQTWTRAAVDVIKRITGTHKDRKFKNASSRAWPAKVKERDHLPHR